MTEKKAKQKVPPNRDVGVKHSPTISEKLAVTLSIIRKEEAVSTVRTLRQWPRHAMAAFGRVALTLILVATMSTVIPDGQVTAANAPAEESLNGAVVSISSVLNRSRVLDIPGNSKKADVRPILWDNKYTPNQRFKLISDGNGYYVIQNINSGLVFDVSGGRMANGATVIQWPSHGGENQKWKLIANDNGSYTIASKKNTNFCIDLPAGSSAKNTQPILYARSVNKASQQFCFDAASSSSLNGKTYAIASNVASNRFVDINGASKGDGASAILWTAHGGNNQKFKFTYNAKTGYYLITSTHSGRALDVKGASTSQGARVIQWGSHGDYNQQWLLLSVGGEQYAIRSASSGMALDVSGGSTSTGASLIVWPYHGGVNQKWTLSYPATSYTVTFNPNGGTVSPASVTRMSGVAIGTLPIPTRTGYTFEGWYTAAAGGANITANTKVTKSVVYYAHWASTEYRVVHHPAEYRVVRQKVETKRIDTGYAVNYNEGYVAANGTVRSDGDGWMEIKASDTGVLLEYGLHITQTKSWADSRGISWEPDPALGYPVSWSGGYGIDIVEDDFEPYSWGTGYDPWGNYIGDEGMAYAFRYELVKKAWDEKVPATKPITYHEALYDYGNHIGEANEDTGMSTIAFKVSITEPLYKKVTLYEEKHNWAPSVLSTELRDLITQNLLLKQDLRAEWEETTIDIPYTPYVVEGIYQISDGAVKIRDAYWG
jgi:uncharacterized repeat protein (TIGR02543 family)